MFALTLGKVLGVGRKPFSSRIQHFRLFSNLPNLHETKEGVFNSFILKIFQRYEDVIGLTQVKHAQNRVIKAEKRFVETQESRRDRQSQIQQLQTKLKEIHLELDKTSRGEDRYLYLITQEHSIIREEKSLMEDFRALEKDERDFFSALSLAVRESHEQERAQAERTKYWSVIGSICGAIIGIVGTTINNRMRMKELRELVRESTTIANQVQENVQDQKIDSFLNQFSLKLKGDLEHREFNSNELDNIEKRLTTEIQNVRGLLASRITINNANEETADVVNVYFGENLSEIVQKVEQNLEWKMKINSLATVAAFYGVLAITVPIIYTMFK